MAEVVHASFKQLVAPDWGPQAVHEFLRDTSSAKLSELLPGADFVAVCEDQGRVVGLLLMPRPTLVQLFFVAPSHVGRGVGRALWEAAREHLEGSRPEARTVELNATPYALPAYKALGFYPISEPFFRNGAVATRMACWLPGRGLERPNEVAIRPPQGKGDPVLAARTSARPSSDSAAATLELDEPIELVAHRAEWSSQAAIECARIVRAVGPAQVEHIGSTAVAGLVAKPTIDLMVGVDEYPAPWLQPLLESLGYQAMGEAGVPGRSYFRRRAGPSFNVHVVPRGGTWWKQNLSLRDFLREDPLARQRYADAKQAAFAGGADTLLSYSAAKAPAIAALLQEAFGHHNRG